MPVTPLLLEKEIEILKEEMRALKECQTKYFCLAVTSTGAIFAYLLSGVNVFFCNDSQYNGTLNSEIIISPVFLTPLLIILPLCCIFFDKAQTVSRLVGYYQILECFSLGKYDKNKFIGWENSLSLLRKYGRFREKMIKRYLAEIYLWEDLRFLCKAVYFLTFLGFFMTDQDFMTDDEEKIQCEKCKKTKITEIKCFFGKDKHRFPKKSQMYLRLIYLTFLLMSTFCFIIILLPLILCVIEGGLVDTLYTNRGTIILIYILFVLSLNTFGYNLKILYQLEMGFHSFKANNIFWETILFKDNKEIDNEIENKLKTIQKKVEEEKKKEKREKKEKDSSKVRSILFHLTVITVLYNIDKLVFWISLNQIDF